VNALKPVCKQAGIATLGHAFSIFRQIIGRPGGLGPATPFGGYSAISNRRLLTSTLLLDSTAPCVDCIWRDFSLVVYAYGRYVFVDANALQLHVSTTRLALGEEPGMLKTVAGRGDRLRGAWTVRKHIVAPVAPALCKGCQAGSSINC
jgi:hypothetical protein